MSESAYRYTNPPRRCERCGRPATYRQAFTGRLRWRPGIVLCRRHLRDLRYSERTAGAGRPAGLDLPATAPAFAAPRRAA